ncbi:MAG: rod shape-determining protein MreC [Daejeonella sp.]
MRNLWILINKYNAFFLLIIFLVASLTLLLNNNSYQKASTWNCSNQLIGTAYEKVNHFESYLTLAATNDSLARENVRLRNQLKSSYFNNQVIQKTVNDSLNQQQYTYTVAQVVNNSIRQENNFITINRGKNQGIEKGMGVIGPNGVVGVVKNVSQNFAIVQSLLHSQTRFSASVNNNIGSLIWGEGNFNTNLAILKDIPNHIRVKKGDRVVSSRYSVFFPAGTDIGRVNRTDLKSGDSFLNIEVKLATDFVNLEYVYVINNLSSKEQQILETSIKTP